MKAKYFIDYVEMSARYSSGFKGLGCQLLNELPAGRKPFSEGQEDFLLTENIELLRGPNQVTVKASKKKPVKGYTIIFPFASNETNTFVHPMDLK